MAHFPLKYDFVGFCTKEIDIGPIYKDDTGEFSLHVLYGCEIWSCIMKKRTQN
jgi:hypothetical protein